MGAGARTPEELEGLLEDAFVTRDAPALCEMFAEGAVLAADEAAPMARGGAEIRRLAATLCADGRAYVAEPRRVLQARDTALIVAGHAINVVRRDGNGDWRYAIALLSFDATTEEEGR